MTILWVTIGFTIFAGLMPIILKMVFLHKVTNQEIGLSIAGSIILSGLILFADFMSIPRNTEIRHGVITDKKREHVSCSHQYKCGETCSGSGNDKICVPIYCDEHPYDVDWAVYNTVDRRSTVPRVDRRGLTMPPRWHAVVVGEPYSLEFSYLDYLQINKNSLFNQGTVDGDYNYLTYPRVYDLYRTNLVLKTHSTTQIEPSDWNSDVRERLKGWGWQYEINIILVFTEYDRNYFDWLRYKWNGGRKNDAVVVIGTTADGTTLEWAEVFSWSKNELFNTKTRSELLALKDIDKDQILGIIDANVSNFERRPMEEFKYLLNERTYSFGKIALMVILQLGINIIIWSVIVHNSETVSTRSTFRKYRRFKFR